MQMLWCFKYQKQVDHRVFLNLIWVGSVHKRKKKVMWDNIGVVHQVIIIMGIFFSHNYSCKTSFYMFGRVLNMALKTATQYSLNDY